MIAFAQTCEAIAATPSKLEKIRLLAAYLRTLDDPNLAAAARFFTGNPLPAREQRSLAIGGSTLVAAARAVWGVGADDLRDAYRAHGDLGAALGPFVRPVQRLALFSASLTPATLKSLMDEIARAAGKNAGRKRQALLEEIFARCSQPSEAAFVIKIITGDLRIGLREGLVADGIAAAFACEPAAVRRAVMAAGDIGAVAVAARSGVLHELGVSYGSPIGFMLASPIAFGSGYKELRDASWITEYKFDGIRAQLHKDGEAVRLFSRTLNNVSHSYPEIVAAAGAIDGSVILDGEVVARKDGRVLPFRFLQARLQRKDTPAELLAEVPVAFMAFDILARDDEFLLDTPLQERRAYLERAVQSGEHLEIARIQTLEPRTDDEVLDARFEEARALGHEGLMLKRSDSPYSPGRRGKWWLKLKRELSTLDVVVVAVEWGHGKRAKVISDYTFAVRGEDGALLTIGKAYSGLTDAEIAELTPWFLEHRIDAPRIGYAMPVQPQIVLEVAFDIIQESTLHQSGFALRFPRIVRIRDDKPVSEIDTVARVREIYAQMLEREKIN